MLRRHVQEILLVLLTILSAIGVALANYSPQSAFRYWLWMAPIFGVLSVGAAWWRASIRGDSIAMAVQRQIYHWVGVVAAVYLIYLLQSTGRMENEAAGLSALIVMSLASFLAGVHGDWRMMIVGVVLGLMVVVFAVLEQIIWVIAIPALLIIIVIAALYLRAKA